MSIIALTLTLALPVAALQPAPAVSPPAEEAGDPGAGTTTVSSPEGRPAQEPSPTVDELIKMRIHGVTPEYVAGMRQILGESLEVDDLVSLRIHGATPELAAGLRAAVGDLGADGLVKAQIHGATAEFAAEMTRLLDTELEIDDLVKMRIHGVSPELVEELREAGYAGLTVEELVKIRIHGIDRILKKRRVRERQGGGR